jgi:hypothetical protein
LEFLLRENVTELRIKEQELHQKVISLMVCVLTLSQHDDIKECEKNVWKFSKDAEELKNKYNLESKLFRDAIVKKEEEITSLQREYEIISNNY